MFIKGSLTTYTSLHLKKIQNNYPTSMLLLILARAWYMRLWKIVYRDIICDIKFVRNIGKKLELIL